MRIRSLRLMAPALLAGLALVAGACSDDNSSSTGPGKAQTYNQVQRLGNPLVSEVLLDKRSHPTHGSIGPDQDAALIGPEIFAHLVKNSPTTFAGRDSGYVGVLASVLLPDMLVVQTDKDPGTASWLNWVGVPPLANGWGGRKLNDDVVDLALLAVFGDPFGADPSHTTPALTTDNVGSDSPISATFPYLAPPN
ncbi:MAG TPA: DUF4331 family protein [Gemmatimonadales bacterium]|nr:DUF4331 family protein [Gemmatimonadales bacterium]